MPLLKVFRYSTTFVFSTHFPHALTCHPDGVVAEQRVAPGEVARVDPGVVIRHIDNAEYPLAQPYPVARHKSSAVF